MLHVYTYALVAMGTWLIIVLTDNFQVFPWINVFTAFTTLGICGYAWLLFAAPRSSLTLSRSLIGALAAAGLSILITEVHQADPTELTTTIAVSALISAGVFDVLVLILALVFLTTLHIPQECFAIKDGKIIVPGDEFSSANPFALRRARSVWAKESDSIDLFLKFGEELSACKVSFTRYINFHDAKFAGHEFHMSDLDVYRKETRDAIKADLESRVVGADFREMVSGSIFIPEIKKYLSRYPDIEFTCKVTKIEWMQEYDSVWKPEEPLKSKPRKRWSEFVSVEPTNLAR